MKYCCYLMKADLERVCVIHQDRWTCGDDVMYLNPETRQYGLKIRDGGRSTYVIHFCPWCGTNLHHHEDKYAAENNTFLTMVKTAQEDAIKKMRVDLKALEAAYLTKPAIPTQERELDHFKIQKSVGWDANGSETTEWP